MRKTQPCNPAQPRPTAPPHRGTPRTAAMALGCTGVASSAPPRPLRHLIFRLDRRTELAASRTREPSPRAVAQIENSTFFARSRRRRRAAESARSGCDKCAVATPFECPVGLRGTPTARDTPCGGIRSKISQKPDGQSSPNRGSRAATSNLEGTEIFIENYRVEIAQ